MIEKRSESGTSHATHAVIDDEKRVEAYQCSKRSVKDFRNVGSKHTHAVSTKIEHLERKSGAHLDLNTSCDTFYNALLFCMKLVLHTVTIDLKRSMASL